MRLPLVLVAMLLVAGCAQPDVQNDQGSVTPTVPATASSATPPQSGPGPAWSLTATDGVTYTRDEPAGEATVFFFMATWCGSCRQKAPLLAEAAGEYQDLGVRFFSLDFDPTESENELRQWATNYGHDWPHAIDTELRMQRLFEVRSQSTVVVLDGEGKLVKHFGYGQVTMAGLRDAIEQALAA